MKGCSQEWLRKSLHVFFFCFCFFAAEHLSAILNTLYKQLKDIFVEELDSDTVYE